MVEQQEPHAGRMAFADVAQPTTIEQRRALARRIRDELELPLTILVDGMDDGSRALFSDLPSPAFVIGRDGTILDKLPWADPEPLARSLAAALGPRPDDGLAQRTGVPLALVGWATKGSRPPAGRRAVPPTTAR